MKNQILPLERKNPEIEAIIGMAKNMEEKYNEIWDKMLSDKAAFQKNYFELIEELSTYCQIVYKDPATEISMKDILSILDKFHEKMIKDFDSRIGKSHERENEA